MPFTPSYHVPESRRAYTVGEGTTGVLMLHGFMGSPTSSRPLADYLADQGLKVHCPLLPGHGELPRMLHGSTKEAWLAEAEEALVTLRAQCDEIVLMAHSMGNVLAAHLVLTAGATEVPFRGLIMLAPAYTVPSRAIYLLRVLRYIMPWLYPLWFRRLHGLVQDRLHDFDPTLDMEDPALRDRLPNLTRVPTGAIDEMRQVLDYGRRLWPRLDLPVIIFQGGQDIAVDPAGTRQLFAQLPHEDKQLVYLPKAGHELMRPFEAVHERVWSEIAAFITAHSASSIASLTREEAA